VLSLSPLPNPGLGAFLEVQSVNEETPVRITVLALEDMSLWTCGGAQNAVLVGGAPRDLPGHFRDAAISTPGVKIVQEHFVPPEPAPPTLTPAEKSEYEAKDVSVEEGPSREERLIAACKHIISRGWVKRDYTPTGRVRVASVREQVDFDFTKAEVWKAYKLADFEMKNDDDSGK